MIENIEEKYKEYGLIMLEKYINCDTKTVCIDKEGYKYSITYSNLKSRKNKNMSSGRYNNKNMFKEYNMKNYIKKNVSNNTNIIKIPSNLDKEETIFECGVCRRQFKQLWKVFTRNNPFFCCQKCAIKQKKSKAKGIEYIRNIFKKNNYELLDTEYKGTHYSYYVKDKDGYIGRMLVYNAKKKINNVERFHRLNKYSFQNIDLFLKKNKIELRCSEKNKEYGNAKKIEFICKCGNKFSCLLSSILAGKFGCNVCTGYYSSNEIALINYFNKNKIEYISQYKISNYMGYKNLYYDFYLPKYNYMIEADGEAHEKPVNFNGINDKQAMLNFKQQKKRDKIKNKYCKENKINLLRINHRDIKNKKYINIIKAIIRKE